MRTWLRCTLYPGQFSSELAAIVCTARGRELSLFASKEDFQFSELPSSNQPVDGWVEVTVLERQGTLLLVRLPRTTLENGQYITVSAGQLKNIPEKREARALA